MIEKHNRWMIERKDDYIPMISNPHTVVSKGLMHVSLDKPFYKANDIVFIETFFVDALTKIPFSEHIGKSCLGEN